MWPLKSFISLTQWCEDSHSASKSMAHGDFREKLSLFIIGLVTVHALLPLHLVLVIMLWIELCLKDSYVKVWASLHLWCYCEIGRTMSWRWGLVGGRKLGHWESSLLLFFLFIFLFFLLFVYFILSKSLFGSTVPEGKFIMTEKT